MQKFFTYKDETGIFNIEYIPPEQSDIFMKIKNINDTTEIPQDLKDEMLLALFKKVFK